MSREIDYNDPDSWTDDDRAYLAERVESVPEQYRHLVLPEQPPFAPQAVGQDPRMLRMIEFIQRNHPERAGEDPIAVAIDLMGGETADDESDDDMTDNYDQWKVKELSDEADRREPKVTLPEGANPREKAPWIAALREWDRTYPA